MDARDTIKRAAELSRTDATAALELFQSVASDSANAPADKAEALFWVASIKRGKSNAREAIEDYNAVLALQNLPIKARDEAMHSRGVTRNDIGDFRGAIADFTTVINWPDSTADYKARALISRAGSRLEIRDPAGELADLNAAIAMEGALPDHRATALLQRAWIEHAKHNYVAARSDYQAALSVPNISDRLKEEINVRMGTLP